MRIDSNTVSNPGAMMIHPHHTFPANWAVMCTWWLHAFAFMTVTESYVTMNINYKLLIYLSLNRNYVLIIDTTELLSSRCSWRPLKVIPIFLRFWGVLKLYALIIWHLRELIITLLLFLLTHFNIRFSWATRISICIISWPTKETISLVVLLVHCPYQLFWLIAELFDLAVHAMQIE